jgi:hypothetical protein
VQLLTFAFYAVVIVGLCLYRRRESTPTLVPAIESRELKLVTVLFGLMLAIALLLSVFAGQPILFLPIVPNFVIWTLMGFVLTAASLVTGLRERLRHDPKAVVQEVAGR